jgi:Tubulin like
MSKPTYFSSVHLIGLGGTGTNVIQSLVESDRLSHLLRSEDFHLACLALDVADGDLASLESARKKRIGQLQQSGISVERLWVKGLNVKFNSPDALFEFMERYNTYLMKEGIVINSYKPWIPSSMSIPPLAGGVGRMRALSKAVYDLNYYHYMELNNVLSVFKDKVLTSKFQPIVVLVFGLGGGTGSGMVFDFARHLRKKLGTSVPIVGIAILPSSADDLLARGPAPYSSLMESELLFNREMNDEVVEKFGEAYRNPFTAQFFLALDPVYNSKNSLLSARKELDEALIDVLHTFMSFDLADLLSRVGTNNDFGPNWAHSMSYLRIRYPVQDYVTYLHNYLQHTETVGNFMSSKKEAITRINDILTNRLGHLKELLRKNLISMNIYRPESFETEVEDVVNRAGKYEVELRKQIKGLSDFASYYNEKWGRVMKVASFEEDTVEYGVFQLALQWHAQIAQLTKTHEEFQKGLQPTLAELEENLTAAKALTSTQIRQIRSYVNFVGLVDSALETLKLYIRAKALADNVAIRYAKDTTREGKRAVVLGETEVVPLFKAAGYILSRPETEVKASDQYVPGLRVIKKSVEDRYKDATSEAESFERLLAQKETEVSRLKRDMGKVKVDFSGKKKLMGRNQDALVNEATGIRTQLEQLRGENEMLSKELEMVKDLEKGLELTSNYRKVLNMVATQSTEMNEMMSRITSTGSYYERVVELSESEQTKIMDKILKEEEESLRGEEILKEIVDRDRFRSMVKSYLRVFGLPSYSGLADSYRTDMIWATVGIPQGLWDQDLQGSLSSVLNSYSSVEASKSISIRQTPQLDPWTITFLVVLAKASVDQIESFSSMKNDADAVRKSEKALFRSFLLEHGYKNVEDLIEAVQGGSPRGKKDGN